jgi:hypothetical protein
MLIYQPLIAHVGEVAEEVHELSVRKSFHGRAPGSKVVIKRICSSAQEALKIRVDFPFRNT